MGEGNIEVKVLEAGTVLLILGAMLGGGTFCSDTRRTPFPLLVADGLQWKGKRGQADCEEGGLATGPGAGNILKHLTPPLLAEHGWKNCYSSRGMGKI